MPEVFLRAIASLAPLAVIAGVIVVIVALVRRRGEGAEEPGIGTVRRLYTYGLSFAGLVAAAIGLVLLVKVILDRLFGPRAISGGDTALALGLALTIVGTPIWLLFWSMAQRAVRQFAAEVRATSRQVYLYLVLAVSGITAAIGAITLLRWVFGAESFSGTPVALVVVWGGVWAFHWMVEERERHPAELEATVRRVYVYVLALLGLILLAMGVGALLGSMLGAAYWAIFRAQELVAGGSRLWNEATQGALAMGLVGGASWWWQWHRVAAGDVESGLRHVYLYLFAILGGAAMVVVSLSVLLFDVLQWSLGSPQSTSALAHFDGVPGVVAAVAVGAGLWGYHWAVVRQETRVAQRGLAAARRVYSYLVSAVGLVTLGVGLVTAFAVALGLLSPAHPPQIVGPDWWRNPLVLAITLLVVGVPVWGLYWREVQRLAAQGGREERAALSRRVFIFLIFGISVLLTLVNLSIVLFRLFDAVLGGAVPSDLLWQVRWSVAILLTAGAVSVYYWLVLQEDRKAMAVLEEAAAERAPEPAAARTPEARALKLVTAVAAEGDLPLLRRLETRLGYTFRVWQRFDSQGLAPPLSDDYLAETERRILEAGSPQVLLLVDTDGIRVLPYRGA